MTLAGENPTSWAIIRKTSSARIILNLRYRQLSVCKSDYLADKVTLKMSVILLCFQLFGFYFFSFLSFFYPFPSLVNQATLSPFFSASVLLSVSPCFYLQKLDRGEKNSYKASLIFLNLSITNLGLIILYHVYQGYMQV